MTDSLQAGHAAVMGSLGTAALTRPKLAARTTAVGHPSFDEVYAEHFDYVWRALRRLGVAPTAIDDAAQDVFVVVHRKLDEFEGRSSIKTWVYGIAAFVARDYRRRDRRKGGLEPLDESVTESQAMGPEEATERSQALEVLDELLGRLDDEKREVFVLAEIEQLTAPEIAEALGVKLNTIYSRLRLARKRFAEIAERFRAVEERGLR